MPDCPPVSVTRPSLSDRREPSVRCMLAQMLSLLSGWATSVSGDNSRRPAAKTSILGYSKAEPSKAGLELIP
ncbi:hypothetical protein CesoFtcFv8_011202 [Champsocephalus esox]|uniref:Uncharacterized protein n=2 Tax=Champsocephalus TaxID=52236 RepID=A0AAN8HPE8_CHAGU|nr:hypothetical protein CesoFtcFv8_011202 [Champsocephalus esox]KAK5923556.1 hypothetical protein CgunFtcFv8_000515 [Champsocephalus gunnari]